MGKRILIIQSNYVPWKGYFDAIAGVDEVVLYDCAQYTRQNWRNRNCIKTARGLRWLTVPVTISGLYTQRICDTRIAEPGWNARHWAVLHQAYRDAPAFDEVSERIDNWYRAADDLLLSRVNTHFITSICEFIGVCTPIVSWDNYELIEGKTERLVHICRQAGASEYVTGPAAKAYLDEASFEAAGIGVRYLDYSGYPVYSQLHGEFRHEVSILDLIFNEGERAARYLKIGAAR